MLGGRGKLYDSEDLICEASYQVTQRKTTDERLDIAGVLRDVEFKILITLPERDLILKLDHGASWHIVVTSLQATDNIPPDHCKIRVNRVVVAK